MASSPDREKRALAVLSSVPLAAQLAFHVWEQWSAFGGRFAYVDRLATTSDGFATFLAGVLFVLPLMGWVGLLARALMRGDRLPGQALPGDPPVARVLGSVVRVVSPIAALGLVVHLAALWLPRITGGETPLWSYDQLQASLGQPFWLAFYGGFVFCTTWHLAASLPDGLEAVGLVGPEGRRSAFIVSAVLGACFFVLYAQLAGWLATGLGTFWPIRIVTSDVVVSP